MQNLAAEALGEAGQVSVRLRTMLSRLQAMDHLDQMYQMLRDTLRDLNR